jgi:uncharacterized membrane protein HdeD (DUF308 family)
MNAIKTKDPIRASTDWSMAWGILMFFCGILAIALPLASSIGIAIILAWLILLASIWHLIFAFQTRGAGAAIWQILLALLYGIIGFYMLMNPLLGVLSLTLLLASFLIVEGVLETLIYFQLRPMQHSSWILLDGIITLILGILIWAQWPSSAAWLIGTLLGISLIFSGISRFMLALAVRRHLPAAV